jgi:hypothetical protein
VSGCVPHVRCVQPMQDRRPLLEEDRALWQLGLAPMHFRRRRVPSPDVDLDEPLRLDRL